MTHSRYPCLRRADGLLISLTFDSAGIHNITFPRSDPVVIAVVVNEDNDKVLLGRNVRQIRIQYFGF